MAARVTRAKKKIAAARIPYRVPGTAELPERLDAVLTVVHLVFTTGHTAPSGDVLVRSDLVDRALELGRLLRGADARRARGARPAGADAAHRLAPRDPAGRRRPAGAARRPGPATAGTAVEVLEGLALVRDLHHSRVGRFGLQAAIAAEHALAPSYAETGWDRGRAALRRAAARVAVTGRRAQPCGRAGRGRRSGGRARRGRPAGRRGPARGLPLPAGDPGRPAAPAGPAGGGGIGVRRRAGAGRQRRRAGVPHRAGGTTPAGSEAAWSVSPRRRPSPGPRRRSCPSAASPPSRAGPAPGRGRSAAAAGRGG